MVRTQRLWHSISALLRGLSDGDHGHNKRVIDSSMNAIVIENARVGIFFLAPLYVLLGIGHIFLLAEPVRLPMVLLAWGVALALILLVALLTTGRIDASRGHHVATLISLLIAGTTLLHIYVVADIKETTNIAIIMIGTGGLMLAARWFYPTLGLIILLWYAVIVRFASTSDVPHYSFLMLSAIVLAIGLFSVRRRSFSELVQLHKRDEQQKLQLETLVAQLREHELDLRIARDAAETANQTKTEFISLAVHDLKSPLTVVLANADLLPHLGPLNDAQRELGGGMRRSVDVMLKLINDLTDTARLEVGQFAITQSVVGFDTIARDAAEALRSRIIEKRQTLTITTDDGIADVLGDWLRLHQIVTNLVTNASTYTPEGGTIRVDVRADDTRQIRLTVADSGIGIDDDDVANLFGRFIRTARGTQHAQGIGLGLYITRQLVHLHSGQIRYEPGQPCGSVFIVTLPAACAAG